LNPDEVRQLEALRDRAVAHLRETQSYVHQLDMLYAQATATRPARSPRHRRRTYLRIIKTAVIGASVTHLIRKAVSGLTAMAAASALTVAAVPVALAPAIVAIGPRHAAARPPAGQQVIQAPRRRRRLELPAAQERAPAPRPRGKPASLRHGGPPRYFGPGPSASPAPAKSSPPVLLPLPVPTLPPAGSPGPSPSPSPSPSPDPTASPPDCVLSALGLCLPAS
jgi:hypothetical protein